MITFLENEEIILEKRKHWFMIVVKGVSVLLAMFLPLIIIAIMSGFIEVLSYFIVNYLAFVIFATAVWWQILWMIFLIIWTNYYLDILIVTNKRIIDIEQLGLFSRDVVEVRLEKIQDVKTEVKGIIASLLGFGDIHVQTAGESREVVVKHIANPNKIGEMIARQYDEEIGRRYRRKQKLKNG